MKKIWIDDIRPAPEGYVWIKSVDEFKQWFVDTYGQDIWADNYMQIEVYTYQLLLDMDHDAGDYASNGGDYIHILNWLEEFIMDEKYRWSKFDIRVHFHSMNPVGIENMRRIVNKMQWSEV